MEPGLIWNVFYPNYVHSFFSPCAIITAQFFKKNKKKQSTCISHNSCDRKYTAITWYYKSAAQYTKITETRPEWKFEAVKREIKRDVDYFFPSSLFKTILIPHKINCTD